MKLQARRDTEIFSLSFMDCICCGFGAIILLLVLTDVDQPVVIERAREAMNGQLLRLQEELFAIRGETDQLNRELQGRIADAARGARAAGAAAGRPHRCAGEFAASRSDAAVANIVETELVSAYQELTAEMERLLKQPRAAARRRRRWAAFRWTANTWCSSSTPPAAWSACTGKPRSTSCARRSTSTRR